MVYLPHVNFTVFFCNSKLPILMTVVVRHVVNFVLYRLVLTFEFVNETIQMKATEQYFPVVLYTMPQQVVPTS